ncbi:MAG: DNA-binding protein [Candidatus Leucobacter sulfamidivorax]|nr:DNA-binding protein [Candidatus Leucobacter sulfamidivorax]
MAIRTNQADEGDTPLTPAEASALSGLTTAHLARMAERGDLTVSKPGGTHRRYVRSEIEALAEPVQPAGGAR